MKKVSVFMKVTAVMLTVAMLMLTIPTSALSPDRVEKGVYYYNCKTKEKTFVPWSDIPQYDYSCTYECLDPMDRAAYEAVDVQYFRTLNAENSADQSRMSDSVYEIVHPYGGDDYLYSGVVLIVGYIEVLGVMIPVTYGSGFAVGGNTVVTAAHVMLSDTYLIDEFRVYIGVDYDTNTSGQGLENYPYYTVEDYFTGDYHSIEDTKEDWAVLRADGLVNHNEFVYCFNVYAADSTIQGEPVYSLGYPGNAAHRMAKVTGEVRAILVNDGALLITNYCTEGMSGGPIYAHVGGRSAIAINHSFIGAANSNNGQSWGTLITDDLLNIIFDAVLDNWDY